MKKTGIPVLMYHALEDDQHPAGAKNQGEQLYVVSVDKFREQMQNLYSNGFKTYFVNELIALAAWPQKAIVLTFDDGHESNYTLALPVLKEFGFKAEFFITTGWIGIKKFLEPNQIIELHKSGMAIGSHSVSHPYFNDLSEKEIEKELIDSKNTLERIINNNITGFSAPGGRLESAKMVDFAKQNDYQAIFTSFPAVFKETASLFEIPRFAIRNTTSHSEFSNIVNLRFLTIFKIQFSNVILNLTKKLLGNMRYEYIRNVVISR